MRMWRWGLWAMTVGVVAFYLRLLWETRLGLFVAHRTQAGHQRTGRERAPHVTIIVPARNEQRNIRRCIATLLAQDYPAFDVLVVDDGSTDSTGAILEELRRGPGGERLTVVPAGELPPDWAGKAHALAVGAAAAGAHDRLNGARDHWLLFTDADTVHRPDALAWALREGRQVGGDLISVLTRQQFVEPWGHAFMPIVMMGITAQYPPAQAANPRRKVAIANGQYLLLSRAMYDRIGGYESAALRSTVLDDRDLAYAVKTHGGQIALLDGREHISVCMYRSLEEAWRGWSKNAYAGSRGGPAVFAVMTLGLPLITIMPFLLFLLGLLLRNRRLILAGGAQVAAILGYRWALDRSLEHSPAWALTHPVGGAILSALLGQVAWRQIKGQGVEWSGRSYQVRQYVSQAEPDARLRRPPVIQTGG